MVTQLSSLLRVSVSQCLVDYLDGDGGMKDGECFNRAESAPLNDTSKPLVLVNYFPSIPVKALTCEHNSEPLINMLNTCYGPASKRWANFVAVDFYKVCASCYVAITYKQNNKDIAYLLVH